jgi:hypothetical protein
MSDSTVKSSSPPVVAAKKATVSAATGFQPDVRKGPSKGRSPSEGRSKCYHCGRVGHIRANCPDRRACYACGGFGHKAANCRSVLVKKTQKPNAWQVAVSPKHAKQALHADRALAARAFVRAEQHKERWAMEMQMADALLSRPRPTRNAQGGTHTTQGGGESRRTNASE